MSRFLAASCVRENSGSCETTSAHPRSRTRLATRFTYVGAAKDACSLCRAADLEWQLAALDAGGYGDITIATGYKSELLETYGLPTVHNAHWSQTNMVSTLLCARDLMRSEQELIVSYSDIVFEPRVVDALAGSAGDIVTVIDRNWLDLWKLRSDDPLSDAETLRLDGEARITEIGQRPRNSKRIQGQYVGLTKFTGAGRARRSWTCCLGRHKSLAVCKTSREDPFYRSAAQIDWCKP